ncbi:MAG: hypothetical protein WD004_08080 [Actinomycetota bacterium]
MSRPPRRREVTAAIRAVETEVGAALAEQKARAAKEVARGKYAAADAMVSTAKALEDFHQRARALRSEWQALGGSTGAAQSPNGDRSKPWEYFEPIQECLRSLGGEAKRQELETAV